MPDRNLVTDMSLSAVRNNNYPINFNWTIVGNVLDDRESFVIRMLDNSFMQNSFERNYLVSCVLCGR